MSVTEYTPKRTAGERLRLTLIAFVLGATLSLPFACNLYGWLLGHSPNIGEALVVLSAFGVLIAKISSFAALALAAIGMYFRRYILAGMGLLGSAMCAALFFQAVYNPLYLFWWLWSYHDIPPLEPVHQTLMIVSGLYYGFILISFYVLFKPRPLRASGTFGSARLEEGDQLTSKKGGLILARHLSSGELLRYNGDQHLITIAPTGQGKGVGSIIPNLIEYPDNIIIIDPKGENCSHTWERRQNKMGQKVICMDPFYKSSFSRKFGTHCINLLDLIPSKSPQTRQLCSDIAQIIVPTPEGSDFWQRSANMIYKGMLQYICNAPEYNDPDHPEYSPELRHIGTISDLISLPTEEFFKYIAAISKASYLTLQEKKTANKILNSSKSMKMLMSILQTLDSNIEILDDDNIRASVTQSNFNFDDVLTKPTTLYIIIPPDKIDTYRKWINMILVSFLNRAIQLRSTVRDNDEAGQILFMLDEFANLGRLEPVLRAFSLLRGYGFTFWIILQDIPQLKKIYKQKWDSFVSNAGVLQTFNTNDVTTAEYLSKLMGQTTVFSESQSESSRRKGLGMEDNTGGSQSVTERGRPLKHPNEIRTMPTDRQLLLIAGQQPIEAKKITYYNDPYFRGKFTTRRQVKKAMASPVEIIEDFSPDPFIESKLRSIIHSPYFLKGLYSNPHQKHATDPLDNTSGQDDEEGKGEHQPERSGDGDGRPTIETHGFFIVDDSPELSEDDVPDIEDF